MDGWIACHLKFEITHMKWNGKNEETGVRRNMGGPRV